MKNHHFSFKVIIVVAASLASVPASAQKVGDWVLSPWRGSAVEFPGVIMSRSGEEVTIKFDDGDVETRRFSDVRPFDWVVGSRISCRWTDGQWYNAAIRWIADDGFTMQVRYDEDGVIQRTNTGRCRTR
jgi:hypothetical protein